MNKIEYFSINNLHGYKNYKLSFKDNTLILIGENGTGKTTILRILYYMLTGQWKLLSKFQFTNIVIRINKKNFTIDQEELNLRINILDTEILAKMPPSVRRRFIDLYENKSEKNISLKDIEYICERYDIPTKYVLRNINEFDDESYQEKIHQLNIKLEGIRNEIGDTQILYLPTYRRIEQELSSIFKGVDEDELRNRRHYLRKNISPRFTELIEFGMKDVKIAVDFTLEKLKEFARERLNSLTLGYLGDVVDQKYLNVEVEQIKDASQETIRNILERIDKKILSQNSKDHLFQTIESVKKDEDINEHAKVICHYFIKLLNFQEQLERMELSIRNFCEVCNNYMENKKFIYDSSKFEFTIYSNENTIIQLDQLSSGEKQIVSLFSHLYLQSKNNFFVMIDEPELSLSVPWQRQFLVDIRNSDFCSGLIAVTHSPFIYDNDLEKFAHGLGEFKK